MSRRPRDGDDDPFDDVFRLMSAFAEEMADNVDRMLGPYGHVEFDVHRESGRPETERPRRTTEAHLDVHDDGETVRVVGDLPGVDRDAIEVRCSGRTLTVTATGGGRRYEERVALPAAVDAESATATYNNGVLEVVLSHRDSDGGTEIRIE